MEYECTGYLGGMILRQISITPEVIRNSKLQDAAACIREVLENAEDDTRILFENADYDLKTGYAYQDTFFISNNDSGVKSAAFYVTNKKNIIIDGCGSRLHGIGRILPFYISGCENVVIQNFEIDYKRPFASQGKILETSPDSVTLKIDRSEFPYVVRNGTIRFTGENYDSSYVLGMLEFEEKEKRPAADVFDYRVDAGLCAREVQEGIVELAYPFSRQPSAGNILTIKHEKRLVPAIVIDRCEKVLVEDVWIKHAGTMGIVAQLSRDITVNRVGIYPDPCSQRVFSVNADALHFVNCGGTITVQDSRFESMFDDVINVHGNYLRVDKVLDERHIVVEVPHFQQEGFFPVRKGNRITVCDQMSMLKQGQAAVKEFRAVNKKYGELELEEPYPFQQGKSCCIDPSDWYPEVVFRRNRCGRNRARGLILTSERKMVIEDNEIDSEGSCIKVNSDMKNWFESGAISQLVIRNNRLIRHNQVNWGKAVIDVDPGMCRLEEDRAFHGEIIIENNDIFLKNTPLFWGYSLRKLILRNNRICLEQGAVSSEASDYVLTHHVGSVRTEGNTFCERRETGGGNEKT